MSETYMITAKTVEEAIAIANREYADENHEVSYEIIDMPKKGFLGIGAKDAKIKITVTKSVSADLGSILADMRGMKVLTAKGESGESAKEKKPAQKQPKQAQKSAGDKQNAPKSKQDGSAQKQPKQNSGNGNAQKPASNAQKPVSDSQKQASDSQKPANPQKQQKAQNQNNGKPKNEKQPEKAQNGSQAQKKDTAPVQQAAAQQKSGSDKPKNERQEPKTNSEKQPKAEPKQNAQPKAEKKNDAPKAEAVPAASQAAASSASSAADVSAKENTPADTESRQNRSSLRNQAKPGKRPQQKKHNPAEAVVPASSMTVSAPMGLTDYVADDTKNSFGSLSGSSTGSSETSSGSRMSNDIRKGSKSKRRSTEKAASVIYEDRRSMITRYDVAESDEDYAKLDTLEDRELTIDEIRASMKATAAEAADAVAETAADEEIGAAEAVVPKPEKLRREAVTEAEMNFALAFANTLLKNMQLDASAVPAECPEDEDFDVTETANVYPKINIIGDDTGILIGHHGETLDAIQYLVNLSALRQSKQKDGDYVKIVVDIENYREKREETLRALARRMAARAVKYKRNVFLEPMNAYERRIIHSELQSVENVSTHSVGADRDRKIIITYEGADKAVESTSGSKNRRRRGGRNHHKNHSDAGISAAEETSAEAAETADSGENQNGSVSGNAGGNERRRPRKVQKMPIEKIGDILVDSEEE